MKTHLLSSLFLFLIPFTTFSQIANNTFSGDYKNIPLNEIIHEIENNSDVKFSYISQIVDTIKITTSFKKESLTNAIDIILDKTPLYFTVVDHKVTLLLDLAKDLSIERSSLTGIVKDEYGKPLPNVKIVSDLIRKKNNLHENRDYRLDFKKQTICDENGVYTLDNLKSGKYQINFSISNYYKDSEQTDVFINTTLNVKLVRKETAFQTTLASKEQNIGILQRTVSIKDTASSLEKILLEVAVAGKFSFEYDHTIIPPDPKKKLKVNSFTVEEFLNTALDGSLIDFVEFKNKIILRKKNFHPQNYTLSGTIKDTLTAESLIGVSLGVKGKTYGNISNQYGYYSLTIPEGDYTLIFSYLGYQPTIKEVSLFKNLKLDIALSDNLRELQEVVISSETTLKDVTEIKMGESSLNIKTIKSMPAFLGEPDVIKSITLLPGVATVGEGTTGFNVRGGGIDQNLVILDEAPIYNTSHLFGLFSVFNPDVVKDVKLYKSGIPSKYGGRLSSVLDVTQKEGNNKELIATGGLGIIGGRFAIEGPLINNRCTFIVAARKSLIGELIKGAGVKGISVGFYDLNAKVNFKINDNNRIYWSAYSGKDNFALSSADLKLSYSNLTTALRWNHLFNDKLFSNFSAVFSDYTYIQGSTQKNFEFEGKNGIITSNLKSDFTYYINAKHTLDYGLNGVFYQFKGLKIGPDSDTSPVSTIDLQNNYAVEPALYLQDEYNLNTRFKFFFGLRYSRYYNIGPGSVYLYQSNQPRSISNITDTINYRHGQVIKQYGGIEPRLSAKLNLNENSALQISYDRSRQYIHLISNTTSATPLDVWKGSDSYIKPEIGDQFSLGYFKNFNENTLAASAEIYYKHMNNVVDYKDGANLIINKAIDADLLQGIGKAYGIEFMLNKSAGRLTGWMSYTYSRTKRQVTGNFQVEKINNGKYYPANYDFPNRITLFAAYKVSPTMSISSNFTYNTGHPTTYPDGRYYYGGFVVPLYSTRNQDRLPDYHRLDLSVIKEGKTHGRWHGQWVLSIFNVYDRRNAYSIYLHQISYTNQTESLRLSIFGAVLPSLTYNFKF